MGSYRWHYHSIPQPTIASTNLRRSGNETSEIQMGNQHRKIHSKTIKRSHFPRSHWTQTGIKRSKNISNQIHAIITQLGKVGKLKTKALQRIRGLLNYYVGFAGNFFSIVNQLLLSNYRRNKLKIMHDIFNVDTIEFPTKSLSSLRLHSLWTNVIVCIW